MIIYVSLTKICVICVANVWYEKLPKTAPVAAILKQLIGPEGSADHPKII